MAKEDLNRCDFIGRLGADPEVRYTQSGKAVCSIRLAVNGWKDSVEWVPVVMWDKLGEIAGQYLSKGAQVYVSGRMQTRAWEDKDGNKRYTTEIVAQTMQMLGGKSDGQKPQQSATRPTKQVYEPGSVMPDDNIPF